MGAARLTPDQYMDLLMERCAAHEAVHPMVAAWMRALPEWFILDGDEHLVDMDAINASNEAAERTEKPARKPRTYRPASYWQARLERVQARMDAINGIARHDTTDPAAYGGVGVRQTGRQQRRHWARVDNAAAEYVKLESQRKHAARMLRAAEKRETHERP